ncbi:hypothetical protein WJX84_009097 [Apatococcus fuscideae]|uniref:histidine kinase n=1 Tax=Apatococcus fuscideae TaxID=2026836 RepID=A0AAW1T9X7_9CHLO
MQPITLAFRSSVLESQYLADDAKQRWPVLIFIFCFDVSCYMFRAGAKLWLAKQGFSAMLRDISPQLANMVFLYLVMGFLNHRSRQMGKQGQALRVYQEEFLLVGTMALAIVNLLVTLSRDTAQDYVYAAFFLICTTFFLKVRWLIGTMVMSVPVILVHVWTYWERESLRDLEGAIMPSDAPIHITVSWAVGALMSFLADTYRRQMFVNHKLAATAAEKELRETQARMAAQHELAQAQAQAQQRALTVAREKAANEAKSEFMSLMCHEVRTPLNGCLASAEMLLDTALEEEQRDLAKTIRVSGSILLSTVSNFLDFFKMEAGKHLDVVRTEIDVKELVDDVHCIIEAMVGRNTSVSLLDPNIKGVPGVVMGDSDRLRGILLNLYTNAAKFTKQGFIGLRFQNDSGASSTAALAPDPSSASSSSRGLSSRSSFYAPTTGSRRSGSSSSSAPSSGTGGKAHQVQEALNTFKQTQQSAPASRTSTSQSDRSASGSGLSLNPAATLSGQSMSQPQSDAPTGNLKAASSSSFNPAAAVESARKAAESLGPISDLSQRLASSTDLQSGLESEQASGPPSSRQQHLSPFVQQSLKAWQEVQDGAEAHPGLSRWPKEHAASAKRQDATAAAGGPVPPKRNFVKAHNAHERAADKTASALAPATPTQSPAHAPQDGRGDCSSVQVHRKSTSSLQESSITSGSSSCDEGSNQPDGLLHPLKSQRIPSMVRRDPKTGSGWCGVISKPHRNKLNRTRTAESSARMGTFSGKWLIFEVADTGVGVGEEGLRALFKEFIQGTSDEMRRPRSRGGTGLGLSICSKQVAVLGGQIGALSRPSTGSIFWVKIPLYVPASQDSPPPSELRRTASWGSRDAFSDGHIRRGQQQLDLTSLKGSSHTRTATTRGAALRKFHQSSMNAAMTRAITRGSLDSAAPAEAPSDLADEAQALDWQWRSRSAPELSPRTGWLTPQASAAAGGTQPQLQNDIDMVTRQSWVSSRSSSSSFESAYGTHKWVDALCLPENMEGLPQGLQDQRQAAIDSLRASLTEGIPPRSELPPVRTSVSLGTTAPPVPSSDKPPAEAAPPSGQNGRTVATPRGRVPLAGLDSIVNSSPGATQNGARSASGILPPRRSENMGRGPKGNDGPGKMHGMGRPAGSHMGGMNVPESIPEAGVAPSATDYSPRSNFRNPFGPDVETNGDEVEGAPPRKLLSRVRPSMEARRKRLDLSALQGRRVLLAEDNLINQTVAKKGPRMFDLVLMDMAMPVMGGVTATEVIRRQLRQEVPIIAMTANASDRDRDECLQAGMDGFLSKPVLKDRLAEAILLVLSGRANFQDHNTVALKTLDSLG